MKRKLTLIIILIALILALTAGSVIAKQPPQTYLNCESGTACTVDAEGGSTVVIWMLGACEVNESPPFVFIMC